MRKRMEEERARRDYEEESARHRALEERHAMEQKRK
jgi:hypothetical protein